MQRSIYQTLRVGHHYTSQVGRLASSFIREAPLTCVASAGHEDIVRELLGAGADVKKTTDKGLTAL